VIRRFMARRFPYHLRGEMFHCFVSDENGKRHEKSLHTKNIDEAARNYEELANIERRLWGFADTNCPAPWRMIL
jgi:hypothetical protein